MKDTSSGGHDLGQLIRPFGDIGKGPHRPVGHLAASFGVIPKGTFLKDQLSLEIVSPLLCSIGVGFVDYNIHNR